MLSDSGRTMAKCIHCGLPEERHCPGFEADKLEFPDGCKCDPESWSGKVTGICCAFVPDSRDPNVCRLCEHNKECHG